MDESPANGEILPVDGGDQPRRGTLAWVTAQGTVERDGERVPACHRIPAEAKLAPIVEGERKCRVVHDSGTRCKAPQAGDTGLCAGHAGVGGTADLDAMRRRANESKARLKMTRQLIGVSAARSADPRVAARLRAALKADDLARAIVDGPLEDDSLSSTERQRAALSALDATFPLTLVTAELSLDADSMDWKSMHGSALSLLG